MATSKKGTTGTKAGAGARRGATKANGVAKTTQTGSTAKGAPASRKAGPVKINDRQREFLTRIKGAGEAGYEVGKKAEQRTIDALVERKLVKRGAKNKESGNSRYLLTRTGEKHLPTAAPSSSPAPTMPSEPPAPTMSSEASPAV
jgi:hypothetical protein